MLMISRPSRRVHPSVDKSLIGHAGLHGDERDADLFSSCPLSFGADNEPLLLQFKGSEISRKPVLEY